MPKTRPTMTSIEAAALYISQGATDDIEKASMIQDGALLDPDALTRAALRRQMGFDFTADVDEKTGRWVLRDKETGIRVTTPVSDDDAVNSVRLAKACLKLKRKHDQYIERQARIEMIPEAELGNADD